jgi:hypothetical protein
VRISLAKRSIQASLTGLAVCTAGMFATAGIALAGTNGQQLAIEPNCDSN